MLWRGRARRVPRSIRGHAVLVAVVVVTLFGDAGGAYAQSLRPDACGSAPRTEAIASSPLYAQSLTESNAKLESGPAAAVAPN